MENLTIQPLNPSSPTYCGRVERLVVGEDGMPLVVFVFTQAVQDNHFGAAPPEYVLVKAVYRPLWSLEYQEVDLDDPATSIRFAQLAVDAPHVVFDRLGDQLFKLSRLVGDPSPLPLRMAPAA